MFSSYRYLVSEKSAMSKEDKEDPSAGECEQKPHGRGLSCPLYNSLAHCGLHRDPRETSILTSLSNIGKCKYALSS